MSLLFHVLIFDVTGVPQLDVPFNLCPYIPCPLNQSHAQQIPIPFIQYPYN